MQQKIVTGDVLNGKNKVKLEDAISNVPVVAYYFSAHWCPPCRNFTPKLADQYKAWNKDGKKIEVVFVTCDQDEESFKDYYSSMPWLAIPYGDDRCDEISAKFKVNSIPRLVIVGKDEKVLTDKGVQDLASDGAKALTKWANLYK